VQKCSGIPAALLRLLTLELGLSRARPSRDVITRLGLPSALPGHDPAHNNHRQDCHTVHSRVLWMSGPSYPAQPQYILYSGMFGYFLCLCWVAVSTSLHPPSSSVKICC